MEESKIRAWWAHRQGLDGSLAGKSAAEVLERAGWARSVGGSAPYLTLFSRAGLSREAIDADVAKLKIHELPSARGCTYVLPASDFALGLALGHPSRGATSPAPQPALPRPAIHTPPHPPLPPPATRPPPPPPLRPPTRHT